MSAQLPQADIAYRPMSAMGQKLTSRLDNKKRARLNCIRHLLDQNPYQDMRPLEIEVPPRQSDTDYKRPKMPSQRFVPEVY